MASLFDTKGLALFQNYSLCDELVLFKFCKYYFLDFLTKEFHLFFTFL